MFIPSPADSIYFSPVFLAKFGIRQANLVHKLHRIEAGTSPHNIGSQIVLTKNGFHFVGTYTQHISNGDDWTDSMIFEKVID